MPAWFESSNQFIQWSSPFVFLAPFLLSLFWIAGALIFAWYRERREPLDLNEIDWPHVNILVPCYNEEETIRETVRLLHELPYPSFDIIAVNDGSTDHTSDALHELVDRYPNLRVIDCLENKGKANALHMAAHASNAEYLVCVDSDAILDPYAIHHLVRHFFHKGERVGAVTGNPRIRNRDTLLSRMQLVEYASIIGSIKRTQRVIGKIMTVSGVVVAFRKKALIDVKLWDRDMITEDIAVSWKLQANFWDIRFEPRALCWMLVPETVKGIWNQRVRWAQGGQEVMFRYWYLMFSWKHRRLWPIYIEQCISTVWSFAWVTVTFYLIMFSNSPQDLLIWLTFTSFALVLLCLIQLFVSIRIDSQYDQIKRYYFWAAWYPIFYWFINAFVVVAAMPKTIKSRLKGGYATWNSPDRGQRKTDS